MQPFGRGRDGVAHAAMTAVFAHHLRQQPEQDAQLVTEFTFGHDR
jgi:hypothetical protein